MEITGVPYTYCIRDTANSLYSQHGVVSMAKPDLLKFFHHAYLAFDILPQHSVERTPGRIYLMTKTLVKEILMSNKVISTERHV